MLDPPPAGLDFSCIGLVVNAPLAARDEFEMLDGIGDVNGRPVDARLLERGVEQCPRGTDERPPGKVLLIARLLADEHDRGVERPLTEDGLGTELVQVAPRAIARILEQRFPGGADLSAGLDPPLGFERMFQPIGRNTTHGCCNERRPAMLPRTTAAPTVGP